MANITIWGASYTDVPACTLPKTGGGTVRFTDTSATTATVGDVASGKKIVLADGTEGIGTLSFSTIYASASAPSSSSGVNGDVWLKTVS